VVIRASPREKVQGNGTRKNDYCRNPPNRSDPGRFHAGRKLAPDEFVVIEVVVGQIQPVMDVRVDSPPGIVIGAAGWARQ
jgi:hypothetical protein